jgi:hypothetical protein
MFGYIYKTINTVNGSVYIGKKKGNFVQHYYGSGLRLIRALRKYGATVFRVEVIARAEDIVKLNELEKIYIAEYKKIFGKDQCYNIAVGGDGGDTGVCRKGSANPMYGRRGVGSPSFGKKMSEETRRKQSVAAKNRSEKVKIAQAERLRCVRKINKGPAGSKHMHNLVLGMAAFVKQEDVDKYKVDGWVLGRKCRYGGFKQGNTDWELRKKNGMIGRVGEKHPFFGKHHTKESNDKNRDAHIGKIPWNKGIKTGALHCG